MSDFIKDYWDGQATRFGTSHCASWGDNYAISLEVENIASYIKNGSDILDIGCANGYSLLHHYSKNIKSLTGVDFSEKMIREAWVNKEEKYKDADNIDFQAADVRALPFENEKFDFVYTTRTLINLPSWEQQIKGIDECLRVARKGGTVLLSEAFWEPLCKLNAARAVFGLSPLVEHDFNRYLKLEKTEELLKSYGLEYEVIDFSSVYYLGSRLIRELVTKIEDYPGFTNPINKIFYNIEREFSGGGVGVQQAIAIRKK